MRKKQREATIERKSRSCSDGDWEWSGRGRRRSLVGLITAFAGQRYVEQSSSQQRATWWGRGVLLSARAAPSFLSSGIPSDFRETLAPSAVITNPRTRKFIKRRGQKNERGRVRGRCRRNRWKWENFVLSLKSAAQCRHRRRRVGVAFCRAH